uniref:Phytochromobilin:ferredoxin oxidoreductase n=1 Tax=Opuntia streptacantha TaxID=393608 RepID=A0A7C8YV50_OPUST
MNSLSLSFWVGLKPSFSRKSRLCRCREGNTEAGTEDVSALSYHKFLDFALTETKLRTHLVPSPLQEKFSHIQAVDGKAELKFQSFEASKIRLLRSMYIHGVDTVKAWLGLMDHAVEETEASIVMCNLEAQHRYLTWRAEKDAGHHMLKRLIGEARARDVLRRFLFSGVDELASKNFLDYFPEYRLENGAVNEKRSVIGKAFENRPWDNRGEFIGDKFL